MSQNYEYSLSLRFHHPSIDPLAISKELRMRPKGHWRAGSPRKNPVGRPLGGTRHDTYWSKGITPGFVKVPGNKLAERALSLLLKRLAAHKRFLSRLRGSGGAVEIWISTYGTSNYSLVATPETIRALSNLGATLIIDTYPCRQN
jgi:hypothetical protein